MGSSVTVFAPFCLIMDDKRAHDAMPDPSLLSPRATERPASSAAEGSHQVVGFAQAVAGPAATVSAAPTLGLKSQSHQQQQQVREVPLCWLMELQHKFLAVLNQLGDH